MSKRWYEKNKDRHSESVRQWKERNAEKFKRDNKKWASENVWRRRDADLARVYGLRRGEYEERLKAQGNRCAICGNEPKIRRLAVDHDHTTGKVRALICATRCNVILGLAKDNFTLLLRAAKYLEDHCNDTKGMDISDEV
jgi:Autographiviridae endonuclease VII